MSIRLTLGLSLSSGRQGGGVGSPYSAETQAYMAALSTQPDDTDAAAVDTFVRALKGRTREGEAISLWDGFDEIKLLANWDTSGQIAETSTCLINMIDPTKYKSERVNAGQYLLTTKYRGVSGRNVVTPTSALNDKFNMATGGVKAKQNSTLVGCWVSYANPNANGHINMGGVDGSNTGIHLGRLWSVANKTTLLRCNDNSTLTTVATLGTEGHYSMNRISDTGFTAYYAGNIYATVTKASSPIVNAVFGVLGSGSDANTITPKCIDTMAVNYIGKGMTTSDYAFFHAALNTLMSHLLGRA